MSWWLSVEHHPGTGPRVCWDVVPCLEGTLSRLFLKSPGRDSATTSRGQLTRCTRFNAPDGAMGSSYSIVLLYFAVVCEERGNLYPNLRLPVQFGPRRALLREYTFTSYPGYTLQCPCGSSTLYSFVITLSIVFRIPGASLLLTIYTTYANILRILSKHSGYHPYTRRST